jgi:hypothetical protein
MKLNISIPDPVWRKIKEDSSRRKLSADELIEIILKREYKTK